MTAWTKPDPAVARPLEYGVRRVVPKQKGVVMKWTIEYDNDTGPSDEGFWEWWTVSNGERAFKCDSEQDAVWLCDMLERNEHA